MGGAMSDLNTRQREILDLVHRKGFAAIEALAQHFEVTTQTIRRDINALCELELLQRYHGGAGLPSSVENVPYATRQVTNLDAKRSIAKLTAKHVPNGASLFINIGTTTEGVAEALLGHERLSVITNNLNVASVLADNPTFEVIVVGGLIRNRDRGIVGEAAIDFINQFHVDIAVIGISGIHGDGSLLDFDYREVRAAQAIMRNADRVFLVADHSKFGRRALVRAGTLSQVDELFTDRPVPAGLKAVLADADVDVHVAERR